MRLQNYDVIKSNTGKSIGMLTANSLWQIYKVIESTTGIPKNEISKHYRVQWDGRGHHSIADRLKVLKEEGGPDE